MSRRLSGDVVPWYNPEEFYKVYQYLYSDELSEKRWAVDQISVWETRCHPNLPTAVEATVVLVRANIQDELLESGIAFCQETDIQLIYAMALVRFINLTIEMARTTKSKIPLTVIAEECKIPGWIVTLRNEATHASCPSLAVLRMGVEDALIHLNKTFWIPESSNLHIFTKFPETDEQDIRFLINTFQVHQYDKYMKGIPFDSHDESHEDLVEKINLSVKKKRRKFIEIFVETGLFIFSEDSMKNIIGDKDTIFISDDNECLLPKAFEDFWMPIIVLFHNHDLIPTFLEILLATQEGRELIEQKYAIAWIRRIIQAVALFDKRSSALYYIFERKGCICDWNKLFFLSLKHLCKYSPVLFPLLTSLLRLNEEWVRRYMCLVAIYQGLAIDKSDVPIGDRVFTVKNIKRVKKRNPPKEGNLWTVAPDHINFSKLPIGTILNKPLNAKTESEEILDDEIMDSHDSDEKFILCSESDKEQDDENIDINSFKKGEQIDNSMIQDVDMVFRKR